jgi:preprotein translocase subunit YajC
MPEVSIDLSPVIGAIEVVNRNVGVVAHNIEMVGVRVDAVAQEQADTRKRVEELYAEFLDYVDKDMWLTEVSAARENLTLVRQKLEKNFGHYDEVRRLAPGVLQAVDAGVVREETIRNAVEEKFLTATAYWLPPGLVCLAAWISDNRPLAERSLEEAIRRDDSKTSLFFALVCRRARRMEACARWLGRYFQTQNPLAMDREVVVMLDALANGVFGGTALVACSKVIDEWLGELEHQAGFQDDQRKRWAESLDVMTPRIGDAEYPTLRKYSPTWPKLEASLAAARRNHVVQSFFETLFTGEIVVASGLEAAVDEVLTKLVTNYDDEELPLRLEARRHEITTEVNGLPGRTADKRNEALRRFQAESDSLKVQTNFAAHLTNATMYHEQYGASPATRRYAVSRSRQWIIAGFNDLTARDRACVPVDVEFKCGSWTGSTRDGLNEQALETDLHSHYATRIESAVNAVQITGGTWAVVVIGALFALLVASGGGSALVMALLIMAGIGAYFYFQYQSLDQRRQQAREELEKERNDATRIMKAALAELVDLRRETAKEDSKAEQVLALLSALSSPQFVLNRPEQGRTIVA